MCTGNTPTIQFCAHSSIGWSTDVSNGFPLTQISTGFPLWGGLLGKFESGKLLFILVTMLYLVFEGAWCEQQDIEFRKEFKHELVEKVRAAESEKKPSTDLLQ